jgi:hypothetical protein
MSAKAKRANAPSREFLEKLFRTAYKIRVFETEGIKLYRQGLIRGYFHPYLGQEGIATGVCAASERGRLHCLDPSRPRPLHRLGRRRQEDGGRTAAEGNRLLPRLRRLHAHC